MAIPKPKKPILCLFLQSLMLFIAVVITINVFIVNSMPLETPWAALALGTLFTTGFLLILALAGLSQLLQYQAQSAHYAKHTAETLTNPKASKPDPSPQHSYYLADIDIPFSAAQIKEALRNQQITRSTPICRGDSTEWGRSIDYPELQL